MDIALMIEGQDGLNWKRWQNLARAAEDLGFYGLYRSDHFTNASGPEKDSLELWVSLTWLASHTSRIKFGPLVSPFSFRNPAFTARMSSAVNDLSGGRLALGLGAGWQEREHRVFNFNLMGVKERFDRFDEGLELVTQLFNSDEPVIYQGKYYQLHGGTLLPRPQFHQHIVIGGNGEKRTLPAVVRYADEWNGVYIPPAEFQRINTLLDSMLDEAGRARESVRRSLMLGCVFGRTGAEVEQKIASSNRSVDEVRGMGMLIGTAEQIREQLAQLPAAGVECVMIQWLDQDDLEGLEMLAKAVL